MTCAFLSLGKESRDIGFSHPPVMLHGIVELAGKYIPLDGKRTAALNTVLEEKGTLSVFMGR